MTTTNKSVTIAIGCGGTGGHIYPAINVADELKQDFNIIFIGSKNRIETKIIPSKGYKLYSISTSNKNPFIILKGVIDAILILKKQRAKILFATGNYISLPTIIAAKLLNLKIILHEQNIIPGKINRYLAKIANKIAVSYENSQNYFPKNKTILSGNPVYKIGTNQKSSRFKLLITGGSGGAQAINNHIIELLPLIKDQDINIVWATGIKLFEETLKNISESLNIDLSYKTNTCLFNKLNLKVIPYLDNMPDELASSSLAITRGGAMTIAELAAYGLPAIIIPYPYAAENHQYLNAKEIADINGGYCIAQNQLDTDKTANIILEFIKKPAILKQYGININKLYKPDAAKIIIKTIKENIK